MAYKETQIFTKQQIDEKLSKAMNHTLGEVDVNHVLDRTKTNPKITGIAGDIIEQSVIGYAPDTRQEADLLIDNYKVELKTTGLREIKEKLSATKKKIDKLTSNLISNQVKVKEFEAKEPMSVTAVTPEKIVNEEFETSHFWGKLEHLLLVYYDYKSDTTVTADKYADFPLVGYEFHNFSQEEKDILKNDWETVRNFIRMLQKDYADNPENEYPRISHELRDKLLYIDTAPKWPNRPRFRLKRSFVTHIVQQYFNGQKNQTSSNNTIKIQKFSDIDNKCIEISTKYKNLSIKEIGDMLYLPHNKVDKSIGEKIVVNMFDNTVNKMNKIPLFIKASIIGKTVILNYDNKGTEDMKLFPIDFNEIKNLDVTFEESSFYTFFAEHVFLCIIFQEPYKTTQDNPIPLKDNIFKGFKKITFSEDFIMNEVQKTWNEIRDLVNNNKLKLITETNKDGTPKINKTGVISEATNFPKSKTNDIFVRGSSIDSTVKNQIVNGLRMYDQYIWIKKTAFLKLLIDSSYIK